MTPTGLGTELALIALAEVLNKRRRGKVVNELMQELKGVHSNTTLNDLPTDFKNDLKEVGQIILSYINKHGYRLERKDT